ncbi:NAD(P)-dependent dehydrogenase (short-subunit alcohol dehydrogenase family) [Jezberella montanilacus]|jgi:NAD(P)-dependent dehydrogenase (short-subunit alcohol dehydrogenase family)|uniref:NAD(P)-dependent dehydrogenase (Short-subunit alcohol dehydrogenase family) n=1 Tax=Jezberella montanilacus TaxID=323426 RepID=A0A2T0XJU3_9BURK|nr:SDR family NAD(P)-dependent oxidoreductase [Jezberella montanilacus]PRY99167.1 NAD(P)-dependent dehydrogenase (short-subunit alcohol dehydrogenase family) [Jezberella montanilacus]
MKTYPNCHMPDDNYVHPYHDLNGAEVLITGGRGTLGAATAEAFAKLGAKVWCLDVSPVPASDSPNIVHRQADVTDRASLEKIQKEIAQGPGLNVLINAHGIQIRTDFAGCDEETWMKLTDVNLNGVYRSCQVFGSPMRQKGGSIVNIGSVNGVVVSGKGTPYGIQKAAVSFMTKVLAVEWAPAVRVNAIAPTAIPSNMTSDLFVNSVYLEKKLPTIPLQRIGSTEDIAHAIVFLSSAASGLITGHTLVMDGGISLI